MVKNPPAMRAAAAAKSLQSCPTLCSDRDLGLIPGLGRSPGKRNGYPLQYSGLENSMDCIVGSERVRTRLSDFHFQVDF